MAVDVSIISIVLPTCRIVQMITMLDATNAKVSLEGKSTLQNFQLAKNMRKMKEKWNVKWNSNLMTKNLLLLTDVDEVTLLEMVGK